MKSPLEQNYYELLEVPRDATLAEIDRAYDRARAYYGAGSVAVYTLAAPDELKLVQDRIDEAYLVLADEKARAEYDARVGPPGPNERPLHREVREAREKDAAREAKKRESGSHAIVADAPPASEPVREPTPPPQPAAAPEPAPVQEAAPQPPPAAEPKPAPKPEPEPVLQPAAPPPSREPTPPVPVAAVPAAEPPAEPKPAPKPEPEPVLQPAAPPPPREPTPMMPMAAVTLREPTPRQPLAAVAVSRPAEGPIPPPPMDFPEPAPKNANRPSPRPPEASPRPPAAKGPDVPPDAVFTGELLKRLRESQGLSLQEIADRTKIGRSHLENIEGDRHGALPAQVYLRGFLMALARELRLDPLRVSKSYLDQVAASKGKTAAKPRS